MRNPTNTGRLSSVPAFNAFAIRSIGYISPTYKEWILSDPWGRGFACTDFMRSATHEAGGTFEQWLDTLPDLTAAEALQGVEPEPRDLGSLIIEVVQRLIRRALEHLQPKAGTSTEGVSP